MMKLMIPAVRRPGMTHHEFVRYVSQVHGPLLLSVPDVVADIRHYHYDFPVPEARDFLLGHPLAAYVDGLTQIWFDDRAAMLRNIGTPGYREKLRPDEENFADASRVVPHLTREQGLVGSLASKYKVFHFRRRRASLSREAFQATWLERLSEVLTPHIRHSAGIVGYVQNHALAEVEHRDGTQEKYFDVLDEFAVDYPSALAALAERPNVTARIKELEAELTDESRTLALVTETQETIP